MVANYDNVSATAYDCVTSVTVSESINVGGAAGRVCVWAAGCGAVEQGICSRLA